MRESPKSQHFSKICFVLRLKMKTENHETKSIISRIKNDDENGDLDSQPTEWRDWMNLMEALFRRQHPDRLLFWYRFKSGDSRLWRSVTAELEDIALLSDVPTLCDVESLRKSALSTVRWTARITMNGEAVEMTKVSGSTFDGIRHIDFNEMSFGKDDDTVYLITTDDDNEEQQDFLWATWSPVGDDGVAGCKEAKGFWQILDSNVPEIDNLDAILALFHHKKLRTKRQFDGFRMCQKPLTVIIDGMFAFWV